MKLVIFKYSDVNIVGYDMKKRNIALLLLRLSFYLDATANYERSSLVVPALCAVAATGITILRLATQGQDNDIITQNASLLKNLPKYQRFGFDHAAENTESNIQKVIELTLPEDFLKSGKSFTQDYVPLFIPTLQQGLKTDVDAVQSRLNWDLYFRSLFNHKINEQRKTLYERAQNISETQYFLLTRHKSFIDAYDINLEAQSILTCKKNFDAGLINNFGTYPYPLVLFWDKIQETIDLISELQSDTSLQEKYKTLNDCCDTSKKKLVSFKTKIEKLPYYAIQRDARHQKIVEQYTQEHLKIAQQQLDVSKELLATIQTLQKQQQSHTVFTVANVCYSLGTIVLISHLAKSYALAQQNQA